MKKYLAIYFLFAQNHKKKNKPYTLNDLEEDYQKALLTHSQVYLDTSWWYVGNSFKEYLQSSKIDMNCFAPFVFMSFTK